MSPREISHVRLNHSLNNISRRCHVVTSPRALTAHTPALVSLCTSSRLLNPYENKNTENEKLWTHNLLILVLGLTILLTSLYGVDEIGDGGNV
jgi:hypothetical protein